MKYAVDENYQRYGGMFDICTTFDKVWNEPLIFKLKQNGILGMVRVSQNIL